MIQIVLLITNRKLHTGFRLLPTSVTCFASFHRIW